MKLHATVCTRKRVSSAGNVVRSWRFNGFSLHFMRFSWVELPNRCLLGLRHLKSPSPTRRRREIFIVSTCFHLTPHFKSLL